MAVGEAHWQNGIVERHIGTFRELLKKLILEDVFEGASNQSVVDQVCELKNRNGSYNGTSPSQWFLGRSRNPLIDSSEASPLLTERSAFEEHLARRIVAAQLFMPQMPGTSFSWLPKPDRESSQKFKQANWSTITDVEKGRVIKDIVDQTK